MRDGEGEGEAGGVVDSPAPSTAPVRHLHTVLYNATKRWFYITYDRFIMVKM